MDKNEKKLYEMLHDQPEGRAEALSESLPPLSNEDKKRITDSALKKFGNETTADVSSEQPEITVSGTEVYKRPVWCRYAGIAAAVAAAFIGIGSMTMLSRHNNTYTDPAGPGSQTSTEFTVNTFIATTSDTATSVPASTTTTTAATSAAAVPVTSYKQTVSTSAETTVSTQTTSASSTTAETTETTALTSSESASTETATTATTESEQPTTTSVSVLPFKEGVWVGESSEGRREITFSESDGIISGNMMALEDNPHGTAAPFQCEIEDNTMVFHVLTIEDNTKAVLTITDDDTIVLNWEYGVSETLTYQSPVPEE